MFHHIVIGVNNLEESRKFYDSVLGILGQTPGRYIKAKDRYRYESNDGFSFVITVPKDGNPATIANGFTLGFDAYSIEEVEAAYKAGIENGGIGIEDKPGPRASGLYSAYLRDPMGNKIRISYKNIK
ncbi:MAG: VOC family protein [Psittacicella sp.]